MAVKLRGFILLLVPFVATLAVPLYNARTPSLLGFPFFYWYLLAWIPGSSLLMYLAYRSRSR
jgi:hypothetical protein